VDGHGRTHPRAREQAACPPAVRGHHRPVPDDFVRSGAVPRRGGPGLPRAPHPPPPPTDAAVGCGGGGAPTPVAVAATIARRAGRARARGGVGWVRGCGRGGSRVDSDGARPPPTRACPLSPTDEARRPTSGAHARGGGGRSGGGGGGGRRCRGCGRPAARHAWGRRPWPPADGRGSGPITIVTRSMYCVLLRVVGNTGNLQTALGPRQSKPCNVGPKSYLRNVAQRGANVSHY